MSVSVYRDGICFDLPPFFIFAALFLALYRNRIQLTGVISYPPEARRPSETRGSYAEEGVVTTIRIPTTVKRVLESTHSKPGQRNAPGRHAPARPPQNVGACHGGAPIKTHVGGNKYRQLIVSPSFPLQLRATLVLKAFKAEATFKRRDAASAQ